MQEKARSIIRWFNKNILGKHTQNLDTQAFGQDIKTKSARIKTKAMKIQKIYGFIQFISKVKQSDIKTFGDQKRLVLTDNSQDYNQIKEKIQLFYNHSPGVFQIDYYSDAILVTQSNVPTKYNTTIYPTFYKIGFPFKEQLEPGAKLPPLSGIDTDFVIYNDNTDASVNEIYKEIIRYAQNYVS